MLNDDIKPRENPNYYSILTAEVRYDKRLTDSEKLLYSEITSLTQLTGKCWASNEYFALHYGVSERTITRRIKKLEECGHITISYIYKDGTKYISGRVISLNGKHDKVVHQYDNPVTLEYDNSVTPKYDKFVGDNNTSVNNTSINIYTVWNENKIMVHKKLNDKMKRKIDAKLTDYSEEEIIQSIKNYGRLLKSNEHYFDYRWSLIDFLDRGLDKMMDWDIVNSNYKKKAPAIKRTNSKYESVQPLYSEVEDNDITTADNSFDLNDWYKKRREVNDD